MPAVTNEQIEALALASKPRTACPPARAELNDGDHQQLNPS